jgi:uncharacterized protein YecT (DUF1311 family)
VTEKHVLAQFLIVVIAVGASAPAPGVPNPQLAKDETPVVLRCGISDVSVERHGALSSHSASCEVIEVIRADTDIEQWDVVRIAYQVDPADFDSSDQAPIPGPAFPTPPPDLVDGQIVLAYLRAGRDGDGNTVYVPNIGIDSFEAAPHTAVAGDSRCRDAGDAGPIMSNEKICAEEALEVSQGALSDLYAELHDRFVASATQYRQSGEQAMAARASGQLQSLTESQAAWVGYRNKTCRLAYYEFYPGSMARLIELDCLKALTDQRVSQLRSIASGSGDEPIRY